MSALLPRAKLAAVLGMLGSDHDGEVLNAARLAERIRRDAGATWTQLLIGRDTDGADLLWRELVGIARTRPELLSPWEAEFLKSVVTRSAVSPKQYAVLRRLAERARP